MCAVKAIVPTHRQLEHRGPQSREVGGVKDNDTRSRPVRGQLHVLPALHKLSSHDPRKRLAVATARATRAVQTQELSHLYYVSRFGVSCNNSLSDACTYKAPAVRRRPRGVLLGQEHDVHLDVRARSGEPGQQRPHRTHLAVRGDSTVHHHIDPHPEVEQDRQDRHCQKHRQQQPRPSYQRTVQLSAPCRVSRSRLPAHAAEMEVSLMKAADGSTSTWIVGRSAPSSSDSSTSETADVMLSMTSCETLAATRTREHLGGTIGLPARLQAKPP
jgi:hypothetical protein